MGLQIQVFDASTSREIDAAFATFVHERPDALFVSSDTFFTSRRVQLVNLATRHAIPTAFANRESTEIGALMSYGTNIPYAWDQSGGYAGRILKGEKPADLRVVQASKYELVVNLKTAKMLGVEIPPTLLARADEVLNEGRSSSHSPRRLGCCGWSACLLLRIHAISKGNRMPDFAQPN